MRILQRVFYSACDKIQGKQITDEKKHVLLDHAITLGMHATMLFLMC